MQHFSLKPFKKNNIGNTVVSKFENKKRSYFTHSGPISRSKTGVILYYCRLFRRCVDEIYTY